MTTNEILLQLEKFADQQTKMTYMRHGAREPLYGVMASHLKKILKQTRKNHSLSLELYATGNSDAMYLAGLMADETKITEEQLDEWVQQAYWYYLSEYAVPWVAAETDFGFNLGLKWIESPHENIASAGWATLSYFAGMNSDENIDIPAYSKLLDRAEKEIHSSKNRVRYAMNGFVIATGVYIKDLTDKAKTVGIMIGKVHVDMNGTACKVPFAVEYIEKTAEKGHIGKKRQSARC